jgi:hypothetical protein
MVEGDHFFFVNKMLLMSCSLFFPLANWCKFSPKKTLKENILLQILEKFSPI